MVSLTIQNITKNALTINFKTVDKVSNFTVELRPLETFEVYSWQYTGDVTTKLKNGFLKEIAATALPPIVTVSSEKPKPIVEDSREAYKKTKKFKKEKI